MLRLPQLLHRLTPKPSMFLKAISRDPNGSFWVDMQDLASVESDARPARPYLTGARTVIQWSGLKGIMARCLALLMAVESPLWCLAQVPVLRLASIL